MTAFGETTVVSQKNIENYGNLKTMQQSNQQMASAATSTVVGSKVASFYAGKCILITGATGFLGKVLLEKLMRQCPDIERIYVILRDKRGKGANARLNEMLNARPFTFHEETQRMKSKVIGIRGDVSAPELGMDKLDRQEVIDKVSLVFHVAASVKFDAPLKENFKQNVFGTENVLKLCEEIRRLECLIHVSTAFADCQLDHVKEDFGPLKVDVQKVMKLMTNLSDEAIEGLKDKLMEGRPNTYTYTKAVAEHLVREYEDAFPIAIVRPSIVLPSLRDPAPGWVDSINGPQGIALAAAVGLLRDVDWNYWLQPEVIPVDIACNSMILAAWHTVTQDIRKIRIYNSTISYRPEHKRSWGEVFEREREFSLKYPSKFMIRVPMKPPKRTDTNQIKLWINQFFGHLVFAYFLDLLIWLAGHKPLLVRLVTRLHKGMKVVEPFVKRVWDFEAQNVIEIGRHVDEQDEENFGLMLDREVDIDQYLLDMYFGLRRYLLKEPDETIPFARKKLIVLYIFEYIWQACWWALYGYIALKMFSLVWY